MQCSRHGYGLAMNAISDAANHPYKSSPAGGDTLQFLKIFLASHLILTQLIRFFLLTHLKTQNETSLIIYLILY